MARKATDTELNELAGQLKGIAFEPNDALEELAQARVAEGTLRNVELLASGKVWRVRIYVGQKMRAIGYTEDLTAACRFADMARQRFWFYRKREACPPADTDMNFSKRQCEADLQNEDAAVHLLDLLEQHMLAVGYIEQTAQPTSDQARNRERRRTVRDDVNARFAELEKALAKLAAGQREIIAAIDSFKRCGIPAAHVDKQDAEVITSAPEQSSMSTQEANIVTKDADFTVHIPDPLDSQRVHHTVQIKIPVRVENGVEILTPEAHDQINAVKREHVEALRANPLTPIGVTGTVSPNVGCEGVEDLFVEPSTQPINEPNHRS